MNSDIMSLVKMMCGGNNQMMSLFNTAMNMGAGKSEQELRQMVSNICSSNNIDLNNAVEQFNGMLKNFGFDGEIKI